MKTSRLEDFGVCVGSEEDRAVVAVRGEVDLLSGPTFRAVLDVAVDSDHTGVIVDLAHVSFIDVAGIRAIAEVLDRLRAADRDLVVRSAPRMTLRVLDIMGASAGAIFEEALAGRSRLEAEELVGDGSRSVRQTDSELVADLSRVGSIRASNAVIDAALRLVTAMAHAMVEGADGVSVSLERNGALSTVAATDRDVEEADADQYKTGEGPCVAAKEEGRSFHIESLAYEDRWPAFIPLAIEAGIGSILSTPLMTPQRPLGSLNIYSRNERTFGPRQEELAALFATHASGILTDGRADAPAETSFRLSDALLARSTIAHAEGILMARRHITPDEASRVLYRAARTAEMTVREQAEELVTEAHGNRGPDTTNERQ